MSPEKRRDGYASDQQSDDGCLISQKLRAGEGCPNQLSTGLSFVTRAIAHGETIGAPGEHSWAEPRGFWSPSVQVLLREVCDNKSNVTGNAKMVLKPHFRN